MDVRSSTERLVYVGTYSTRGSEGIYILRLDAASGALDMLGHAGGIQNPSFLAVDAERGRLFAVQETGDTGAVAAFLTGGEPGRLDYLNQQPSHGSSPCHVSVDQTGRYVVAANYGSGSVCMLPVLEDGSLGPASDWAQHEGSSVNPQRQAGPHAHSATIDPINRYAFVADLGLDRLVAYRLDLEGGKLVAAPQLSVAVTPGAGPRHFAFHPWGRHAYLINELGNTIVAYGYESDSGALTELQVLPTLPADFEGRSACADIHVHPSGRFVYGSNRGHDSLVTYAIDERSGELAFVGHESTGGRNPRNFAIDLGGELLLAANQDTDAVVVFRIDGETGRPKPTGRQIAIPAPVCLQIVPV